MGTIELRKEIKKMIHKNPKVKEYIHNFEEFAGVKYSGRLTVEQLNDLITWCKNAQITAEREYRNSIGGLLC